MTAVTIKVMQAAQTKDIALHSLCMLFYNVWYEVFATFHHGRTPLQLGKMMS